LPPLHRLGFAGAAPFALLGLGFAASAPFALLGLGPPAGQLGLLGAAVIPPLSLHRLGPPAYQRGLLGVAVIARPSLYRLGSAVAARYLRRGLGSAAAATPLPCRLRPLLLPAIMLASPAAGRVGRCPALPGLLLSAHRTSLVRNAERPDHTGVRGSR